MTFQKRKSCTQCDMIKKLITRVESMEDQLCRCQEGKGKGKAVVVTSSPILGSPLILDRPLGDSDGSYHTPPVASAKVSSSSSGSNKENVTIGSQLVEIKDEVMENPLHVPAPELDFQGIARLMAVRGQCAVRSKGPPKSTYHPYARCCAIEFQPTDPVVSAFLLFLQGEVCHHRAKLEMKDMILWAN